MNRTAIESSPARRPLARQAWGFIKCLLRPSRCREVDELLYLYVEGDLSQETQRRLEKHIADCPACMEYVQSYRRVVFLTGQSHDGCPKMPPELERKLEQFIETNPHLR
jgi:anti-sigma factor RsiW